MFATEPPSIPQTTDFLTNSVIEAPLCQDTMLLPYFIENYAPIREDWLYVTYLTKENPIDSDEIDFDVHIPLLAKKTGKVNITIKSINRAIPKIEFD